MSNTSMYITSIRPVMQHIQTCRLSERWKSEAVTLNIQSSLSRRSAQWSHVCQRGSHSLVPLVSLTRGAIHASLLPTLSSVLFSLNPIRKSRAVLIWYVYGMHAVSVSVVRQCVSPILLGAQEHKGNTALTWGLAHCPNSYHLRHAYHRRVYDQRHALSFNSCHHVH